MYVGRASVTQVTKRSRLKSVEVFVSLKTYLRELSFRPTHLPLPSPRELFEFLVALFLNAHTTYDVMPLASFFIFLKDKKRHSGLCETGGFGPLMRGPNGPPKKD